MTFGDCLKPGFGHKFRFSFYDLKIKGKQREKYEPEYDALCAKTNYCCWQMTINNRDYCSIDDVVAIETEHEAKMELKFGSGRDAELDGE